MRYTHYIPATEVDTRIDSAHTYQVGQIAFVEHPTGTVKMRLAGYRRQRGNAFTRSGVVAVWMNVSEWRERHSEKHAQRVRNIVKGLTAKPAQIKVNTRLKTVSKRARVSAPPIGYASVAYFRNS